MAEQDEVIHRVTSTSNWATFSAELNRYGTVAEIKIVRDGVVMYLHHTDLSVLVGFVARVVATRERLQAESAAAQPTHPGSDQ